MDNKMETYSSELPEKKHHKPQLSLDDETLNPECKVKTHIRRSTLQITTDVVFPELATPIISLCKFLNHLLRRTYKYSFNIIHTYALEKIMLETPRSRNSAKNLFERKSLMIDAVKSMVWTGKFNQVQRPLWRWKFQCGPKNLKQAQSFRRNLKSALRILWNRFVNYRIYDIQKVIAQWKRLVKLAYKAVDQKINLTKYRLGLNHFKRFIVSVHKRHFIEVEKVSRLLDEKYLGRLLNAISEGLRRAMKKSWDMWASNLEYYYEEYEEEVLNKEEIVIHHYHVTKKPCVTYYYHDFYSYDPAFQAVFRNLSHFIKRKMRLAFRDWTGILVKKPSLLSLGSFATDCSIDYQSFKVPKDNSVKLQSIVTELTLINEKMNEMPKRVLTKWAEATNIRNLKINRIRLIISKNQKKNEDLRYGFMKMCYNLANFPEFTDLF